MKAAPLRPRPQHLEETEQATFVDWAQYHRVVVGDGRGLVRISELLIAIPNGAHLAGNEQQRAMQMARLKRLGLKVGAADLLLALPRGEWRALWLEAKKPRFAFDSPSKIRAAVSDEQRAFGELMQRLGYRYVVCYGFDELKRATLAYVEGRDIVLSEGES